MTYENNISDVIRTIDSHWVSLLDLRSVHVLQPKYKLGRRIYTLARQSPHPMENTLG